MSNVYPLPEIETSAYTYPIAQYDHDEGEAISGGYEYTGNEILELKGKYLFGNIVRGRLFYINVEEINLGSQAPVYEWKISFDGQLTDPFSLCDCNRVDLRFGRDSVGEMYMMTEADGKIYKMKGVR